MNLIIDLKVYKINHIPINKEKLLLQTEYLVKINNKINYRC